MIEGYIDIFQTKLREIKIGKNFIFSLAYQFFLFGVSSNSVEPIGRLSTF